jgi:PAS domain S-box-containing protein
MKYRTRLFLIFFGISILPFSLLFYFSYQYNKTDIIQQTQEHLFQISKLKEVDFERWLTHNKHNIENLAQRPLVREFTQLLTTRAQDDPLADKAHSDLIRDHLQPNLDGKGGFIDFTILRASDGYALVSTDASIEKTYQKNKLFFLHGLNSTFIDQVRYEISREEFVLHVSTPIKNAGGKVVAVLAGHLDLREMSSIMAAGQELKQTEDTYLINTSNFFVTDSRFAPGSMLTRTAYTSGITNCLAGISGFDMYSDYRDVPVLGYYKWLPEHQLCMLTEIDQSEAYIPVNNLFSYYITLGSVSVLGMLAISAGLSRSMTKPITALEAGTRAIGSGDLQFRLNDISRDEVGAVSLAFNQMAQSLQRSRTQITHTRDLLSILQQAAQTIQNLETHAQVFEAAGAEISKLGFETSIFAIDPSGKKLSVSYLSFDSRAIKQIENLIGKTRNNYLIPIKNGSVFQQVIEKGDSLVVNDINLIIKESIPKIAVKYVEKMVDLLNIRQGIVCRLRSGNHTYGILVVSGRSIGSIDVTAVSTFANQMANALHHIDLVEAISHAAAQLEDRVQERTSALEESRMASLNMMEDLQKENAERKIAQKNLLHEKEKAQRYLDIAGTMLLALDSTGDITLINREGCQVLGYKESELLGRNWFETCLPEDSVKGVKGVFQQIIAGDVKPVQYYENPIRTKAGELRTIAWHNSLIKQEGKIVEILSSGQDITDSRIAQQEIRDSRDKYQSLFTSMLNGFALHEIICDDNGKPIDYRFLEVNSAFEKLTGLKPQDVIGRTVLEVLPKTESIWIENYGRVALTGEPVTFEQYASQIGKHFFVNVYSPKRGQFAATFSDVTDRVQAEHRIQSLLEISSSVTQKTYDQNPLQVSLEEIKKHIPATDTASIWLFNSERQVFEIEAWVGFEDAHMKGLIFEKEEGIIGFTYKTQKGVIRNNIPSDKIFSKGLNPGLRDIKSLVCVPLVFQNKVIGAISVDNTHKEDAFTTANLAMLETISNNLSGLIENSRLFEQVQRSREELRLLSKRLVEVHEEERKLVAMDLHDYFGQVLTSLKLSMRPESFVKKTAEQQQELIHGANLLIDEIMDSAEDLSLRLRPTIIDDLDITPAFEWHVNRYKKQTDLNIILDIALDHGKRYPPDVEIALYRVMEEGLTNAARYAGSTEIKISVWEQDQYIHMTIQDDGAGFDIHDIETKPGQHTGITGIKERVRLLSGSMEIISEVDFGTSISVSLPISSALNDQQELPA